MIDVLVDGRPVRARTTGVGRIVTSLVGHMKRDGRFRFHIVGVHNCEAHWPDRSGLSFVHAGPGIGPTPGRRMLFEQHELRRIIARVRPAVYWATWDYGVPLAPPCPAVLTVHDLIPLRQAAGRWTWDALAYKMNLRLSLANASAIVADSEATKEDLARQCGVAGARVSVIAPGVSDDFSAEAGAEKWDAGERPFVLYVGGYAPRKNFSALLAALEALDAGGGLGGLTLVATGSEEKLDEDSRRAYARLKGRGIVRFVGTVPNERLPALYREASVFVFPSLAEGFGFPPLEAMACGTPVVCGRSDSLPEVVGDAAHLVDVRNPADIAAGIAAIVGDPSYAARLREAGLAQAAKFRWSGAATRMADVLIETAARKPA